MKQLVEDIVGKICAEKYRLRVSPVMASLKEILAHPDMQEAVKECMRSLAVGGRYRAAIDVKKEPLLIDLTRKQ